MSYVDLAKGSGEIVERTTYDIYDKRHPEALACRKSSMSSRGSAMNEGFLCVDALGNQVRLKAPSIVNRCRTYAQVLAERLAIRVTEYRLPYDDNAAAIVQAPFRAALDRRSDEELTPRLHAIEGELRDFLGEDVGPSVITTYAVAALAGQIAIEAGLVKWNIDYPLFACGDYLEILLHARWAQGSRQSLPHAGSGIAPSLTGMRVVG